MDGKLGYNAKIYFLDVEVDVEMMMISREFTS
jgi:hypothetical protein